MASDPGKLESTVILGERPAASADSANETPLDVLFPGNRLGNYLILCRLGGGGMGVVYKAHDAVLNRTVALKVLPSRLCGNPRYLQRFRTEAEAQARLCNPYVVTLYSLMETPAGQVLVMEYLEGQTLEQRLRQEGWLAVDEAVSVFEQALLGAAHVHRAGIIHRDLKPGNIFVTGDGQVKLMDFGVARILDSADPARSASLMGTLLYISPEQINGRAVDVRSDLYTLGISLFETVTGRLPFERRTDYALMHAHVQESPPRPRQYQRRLPKSLEYVILQAIEKDPQRRFQSALEFRRALLTHHPVAPRERLAVGRLETADPRWLGSPSATDRLRARWQRLRARNRLGGLGFDAALVAAAVLLILALGAYPRLGSPPAHGAAPAPGGPYGALQLAWTGCAGLSPACLWRRWSGATFETDYRYQAAQTAAAGRRYPPLPSHGVYAIARLYRSAAVAPRRPGEEVTLGQDLYLQRRDDPGFVFTEVQELYTDHDQLVASRRQDVTAQLETSGYYRAEDRFRLPAAMPSGRYYILRKLLLRKRGRNAVFRLALSRTPLRVLDAGAK